MSRPSKAILESCAGGAATVVNPRDYIYVNTRTGTGLTAEIDSGFQPDAAFIKKRSSTNLTGMQLFDRVRGPGYRLDTTSSTTGQVLNNDTVMQFGVSSLILGNDATSGTVNTNTHQYLDIVLKRLEGFFDIQTWNGNSTNRLITHALNVVPELIIVKKTSGSAGWAVYCKYVPQGGNTGYFLLNSTAGFTTSASVWNNLLPTTNNFAIGTNDLVNTSGASYVAYLLTTRTGVSRVGFYTGGIQTSKQISIGFSPSLVLIKRVDTTSNWFLFDISRGINTPGNDPKLYVNTTAAEITEDDPIDIVSAGFVVKQTASNLCVPLDGNTTIPVISQFGTSPVYGGVYAQGVHVIVGGSGKLAVSADGTNFVLKDSKFGTSDIRGIAHDGNSTFVITGMGGKVAYSTDKGETWTLGNSGVTSNLFKVAYGAGKFVVVGTGVRYSSDGGKTWTAVSYPEPIAYNINFVQNIFLAGGYSNGRYQTSTDGITWSARTFSATTTVDSFGFGDGQWLIGCGTTIRSTQDFVSHTTRNTTTDVITGFSTSPDGLTVYAAGNSGELRKSEDGGFTWVKKNSTTMGTTTAIWNTADYYMICGGGGVVRQISGGQYIFAALA